MNTRPAVLSLLIATLPLAGHGAVQIPALPQLGPKAEPQIVERGPHHRKWVYVSTVTTPSGRTIEKTNAYTELGTGLHYWKNGQWVELPLLYLVAFGPKEFGSWLANPISWLGLHKIVYNVLELMPLSLFSILAGSGMTAYKVKA